LNFDLFYFTIPAESPCLVKGRNKAEKGKGIEYKLCDRRKVNRCKIVKPVRPEDSE